MEGLLISHKNKICPAPLADLNNTTISSVKQLPQVAQMVLALCSLEISDVELILKVGRCSLNTLMNNIIRTMASLCLPKHLPS